jgi:tubulin polyglutamylase TTLL5
MQALDTSIWSKIPGQTFEGDGSDSEDEEHSEERERRARARKGLEEIAGVLGDRWLDVPCVDFSPVPQGYNGDCMPPRLPPSQWGVTGPPLSFRMEHVRAPVVRDSLVCNGLTQTRGKDWLVMWSGPRMRDKEYQGLHELQRVNHFPGSTELTRKDRICVHFEKMAKRFGSGCFNFLPETYTLPRQVDEFLDVYQNNPNSIWIVKPNASSQGKGIFLLKDINELPNGENDINVISRYIDNPLLIQGLKFDLRVYV